MATVSGRTVTLKLKRSDFQILTRRHTLPDPTQLTDRIYRHAKMMFDHAAQMGPFRLIGVGISDLGPESNADQNNFFKERTRMRYFVFHLEAN